jgi:adenosylhomocysteinase
MLLWALESGGATVCFIPMFYKYDVHSELIKGINVKLGSYLDRHKFIRISDFVWDCSASFASLLINEDHEVKGVIEQTSFGVKVYKEYDSKGLLRQPVFDLDSSHTKRIRENRLATGLGLVDALLKLHIFLPDKRVLIVGFGNVGYSCAYYLKLLGCIVDVYDIDTSKMREAKAMGYHTGDLRELLPIADIVITATGSQVPALDTNDFYILKRGAILVNMGGNGWNRKAFSAMKTQKVGIEVLKVYRDNGNFFYEVARGAPINLILSSGTDIETMDRIFFIGALTMEYLVKNYSSLPKHVLPIPNEIQRRVI